MLGDFGRVTHDCNITVAIINFGITKAYVLYCIIIPPFTQYYYAIFHNYGPLFRNNDGQTADKSRTKVSSLELNYILHVILRHGKFGQISYGLG